MEKIRKNRTIWLSILLVILTIGLCVILFMPNENQTGATLTVGFIQTGEINDDGWNGEHYRAVKQACEKQGVELIVRENIDEMSGECEQAIRELVDLGADMIILNSYNYGVEVSDVIEEYDGIAFYGISSEYRGKNMSAYFVRMYQARYLAGIVAGMQSENGKIGYVAAMPNNEVNRGISAFALGVRSVAPEAEVIVTWTGAWDDEAKETEAVKQLVENEQIDTVTYHQNQEYVIRAAEELGILSIGYHEYFEGYSERYLTAAVSDWEAGNPGGCRISADCCCFGWLSCRCPGYRTILQRGKAGQTGRCAFIDFLQQCRPCLSIRHYSSAISGNVLYLGPVDHTNFIRPDHRYDGTYRV